MEFRKWTEQEDSILLEEIANNVSEHTIAVKHNRTITDVKSRLMKLAYKMYEKNVSIIEILDKTNVDEEDFIYFVNWRHKNYPARRPLNFTCEISELRKEIYDLVTIVNSFIELVKNK